MFTHQHPQKNSLWLHSGIYLIFAADRRSDCLVKWIVCVSINQQTLALVHPWKKMYIINILASTESAFDEVHLVPSSRRFVSCCSSWMHIDLNIHGGQDTTSLFPRRPVVFPSKQTNEETNFLLCQSDGSCYQRIWTEKNSVSREDVFIFTPEHVWSRWTKCSTSVTTHLSVLYCPQQNQKLLLFFLFFSLSQEGKKNTARPSEIGVPRTKRRFYR